MRSRKLQFAALAVTLAVALLAVACGDSSDSSAPSSPSGDVEVLAPADLSVADYAGKPLVVNFFGSWCGPCKAEAPALAEFAAAHPEAQFVGIAVNDSEDAAVGFMKEYGLSYPIVIDDGSLGSSWGISGVPTTIFINSDGQEADRIVGSAGSEQFEESLEKAQ